MATAKKTTKTTAAKPETKAEETVAAEATVEKKAPAKKATTKKAAPKKTAPKKPEAVKEATAVKKEAVKEEAAKVNFVVEIAGKQISADKVIEDIKAVYGKEIKNLTVYFKPEDKTAYFDADGETGKMVFGYFD